MKHEFTMRVGTYPSSLVSCYVVDESNPEVTYNVNVQLVIGQHRQNPRSTVH